MDDELVNIIKAIHATPPMIVFAASGCGVQALAWLQAVPGCSRTLLEGIVPYHGESFNEFIGFKVQKYSHPKTARVMAGKALRRGIELSDCVAGNKQLHLIGISCTGALSTDRQRKGANQAYLSAWDSRGVIADYHVIFSQETTLDRYQQECMVSRVLLNMIAEHSGVSDAPLPLHADVTVTCTPPPSLRDALSMITHQPSDAQPKACWLRADGTFTIESHFEDLFVLSGSFNPLHAGHSSMLKTARSFKPGLWGVYEISATNADKPPLDVDVLALRLSQFSGKRDVIITNQPTFVGKCSLFSNCTFLVGYDTADRIVNPRYYGGTKQGLDHALGAIRASGCHFLVAARLIGDKFHENFSSHPNLLHNNLFQDIPAEHFRLDISSTNLRHFALMRSQNLLRVEPDSHQSVE